MRANSVKDLTELISSPCDHVNDWCRESLDATCTSPETLWRVAAMWNEGGKCNQHVAWFTEEKEAREFAHRAEAMVVAVEKYVRTGE